MERESRLEAGAGTAEDREEALREAMDAAAQQCANIRAQEQTSLAEVGAFLGIIGVFVGIIGVLMSPRFGPRAIDFVYAGLLALLIVPLAWVMMTEPRRQCRKHVLPGLADRIWTLEPTREQLVAILDEYRDRKAIIGKAFSADQVLAACVKAAERWQRSA